VLLVRAAPAGASEPLEVYMIRRHQGMRFLGGYYAFPGGKVDESDATADSLDRVYGLRFADAEAMFDGLGPVPALAYWVTAVRELLEETGVLLACDASGRTLDASRPEMLDAIDACRKDLMTGVTSFATLLAREGWYVDARQLTYLSHFVTPRSSPIRFAARFFVCVVSLDQEPRLVTDEASEGFWIHPGAGYRRFLASDMAMAEPAEYGLGYLTQFASLEELGAACHDGTEKFHGIIHRIDAFWEQFDWKANRWPR
jgi:8-oxo-dGTP pyrophosphatase MutT (NUDIX family)